MDHVATSGKSALRTRRALRSRRRSLVPRPAIDALAAFLLFLAATMSIGIAPTAAHPNLAYGSAGLRQTQVLHALGEADDQPIIEIATTASATSPDAVFRRTSTAAAWVLLSFAFSLVAALNLAFIRHMRRAYANPRGNPQT